MRFSSEGPSIAVAAGCGEASGVCSVFSAGSGTGSGGFSEAVGTEGAEDSAGDSEGRSMVAVDED